MKISCFCMCMIEYKLNQTSNTKCWEESAAKGIIKGCCYECQLLQPFGTTVWQLLSPKFDAATSYNLQFQTCMCLCTQRNYRVIPVAVLSIAKNWKPPKFLSAVGLIGQIVE